MRSTTRTNFSGRLFYSEGNCENVRPYRIELQYQYHKHGNSKKFEATHEQELAMHREAKKAFDAMGLKKLPTIKSLSSEYEQQLAEKRKLYAEYQKVHVEMQEMLIVRANMEQILQQDAAQIEQERNRQNVR